MERGRSARTRGTRPCTVASCTGETIPRRRGRRLQLVLHRLRQAPLARSSHIHRRGPAERAHAGEHNGRTDALRGDAREVGASPSHARRPSAGDTLPGGVQRRAAHGVGRLQQPGSDFPIARSRGDPERDGQRPPGDRHRWRRAHARERTVLEGRLPRPLGRRHLRGRDAQLQAGDQLPRLGAQHAPHRALHAHRREHAALRVHGG